MNKLCIIIGMTVVSYVGWWLGEYVGDGTAILLSSVGSLLGGYLGWKINRDYLS